MINRIKAEIETTNNKKLKLRKIGSDGQQELYGMQYAYEKCLKWAEEIEKELKESLTDLWGENDGAVNERVEKAFHSQNVQGLPTRQGVDSDLDNDSPSDKSQSQPTMVDDGARQTSKSLTSNSKEGLKNPSLNNHNSEGEK